MKHKTLYKISYKFISIAILWKWCIMHPSMVTWCKYRDEDFVYLWWIRWIASRTQSRVNGIIVGCGIQLFNVIIILQHCQNFDKLEEAPSRKLLIQWVQWIYWQLWRWMMCGLSYHNNMKLKLIIAHCTIAEYRTAYYWSHQTSLRIQHIWYLTDAVQFLDPSHGCLSYQGQFTQFLSHLSRNTRYGYGSFCIYSTIFWQIWKIAHANRLLNKNFVSRYISWWSVENNCKNITFARMTEMVYNYIILVLKVEEYSKNLLK